MDTDCGGCQGLGSHRKHCRRSLSYNRFLELADQAEDLGDRIGPNEMGAANHAWAAAGLLREHVRKTGAGYLNREAAARRIAEHERVIEETRRLEDLDLRLLGGPPGAEPETAGHPRAADEQQTHPEHGDG